MIPKRKLSWIEKRVINAPSTRLRLKAMCHELKKEFINENIDILRSQSNQLFKKINGGSFTKETYKNWWDGVSYPTIRHREELQKICPKSIYWLNETAKDSPMLRHFLALDIGKFEALNDEEYISDLNTRSSEIYDAIHTVWSIFTSNNYKTSENSLDFFKQAPGVDAEIISENDAVNRNSYFLPAETKNSYQYQDPKSIFLFLHKLSKSHPNLSNPFYLFPSNRERSKDQILYDIWILDMASLTLLLEPSYYQAIAYDEQRKLGNIQKLFEDYRHIFFDTEEHIKQRIYNGIDINKRPTLPNIESNLIHSDEIINPRYEELLLSIGITLSDMRKIIGKLPIGYFENDITQAGLR